MAAQRLLEALAEQCRGGSAIREITVVGDEGLEAYDRVNLATALDAHNVRSLCFDRPDFPDHVKVIYQPSNPAIDLSLQPNHVRLQDGGAAPFDALVLATGADAARPSIPGSKADGCFVFRSAGKLNVSRKAIIVGGGLLGIELARHLHERGQKVHIIECGPHLMPLQMDYLGAEVITRTLRAMGVEVLTNTLVKDILLTNSRVSGVRIDGGVTIDADFVVFATGIRPRDALAASTKLAVGKRGGFVVDNYCRTNVERVFAIGDCAVMNNQVYGLVAPAYLMADALGRTLTTGNAHPVELPAVCAKLKFTGCDTVSFGDSRAVTSGVKASILHIPGINLYRKLVTQADGSRLIGGILVGDITKYSEHLHWVNSGDLLGDRLADLLMPPARRTESEIPNDAIICSCLNVRMGDIAKAVRENGCATLADIKLHTKAGTGCGGCQPAIAEILYKELRKRGLARIRARLWQVPSHGEILRGLPMVPVWRAGLYPSRGRVGEALSGIANSA
jgi:nitrite reductase (NADH) large subunit